MFGPSTKAEGWWRRVLLGLRPKLRSLIELRSGVIDWFRVQLLGGLIELNLKLLLLLHRLDGTGIIDVLRHTDHRFCALMVNTGSKAPAANHLIALHIDPHLLQPRLKIVLQCHLDGAMKGNRFRGVPLEKFPVGVPMLRLRFACVRGGFPSEGGAAAAARARSKPAAIHRRPILGGRWRRCRPNTHLGDASE